MELGGIWTLGNIEEKLETLPDVNARKEAITTQMRYLKDVIGVKGDRTLLQKSHKGRFYTLSELVSNLKMVLEQNPDLSDSPNSRDVPKLSYKNPDEISANISSQKRLLLQKLLRNRKKIIATQQRENLPHLLETPTDLVGCKIKHKCIDAAGQEEWFTGQVLSIYQPGKKVANNLKLEYDVKYDDSPNDTWHFNLLMDLKKGDLVIID